jgi:ABC-2 type transport system permease protein
MEDGRLSQKDAGLLIMNVIRILSGTIIPLTFFPDRLHKVVMILPMKLGFDFPISIYLGKIAVPVLKM